MDLVPQASKFLDVGLRKLARNLPSQRRLFFFLREMAVGGDVGLDGDHLVIIVVGDGVVVHVLGLPMSHHGLQLVLELLPHAVFFPMS